MQTRMVVLASQMALATALAASLASGCKTVDCGDGTTERDGTCVAASQTVGSAKCGPFTKLQGDTCVPMFPPAVCDDTTTEPEFDQSTGVTTCIGNGVAAGCAAKLACTAPASGKQTICGQLYDFETGAAFAATGAVGTRCTTTTSTGPCALGMRASDPAAGALNIGDTYVDDCGRFRLQDVSQPGSGIVAVVVDDVASPGPMGLANPAVVSLAFQSNVATPDIEAFTVKPATIAGWSGPSLASGIYAPMYRGHRTGSDLAPGVTVTRNGAPDTMNDYYFAAGATSRTTVDTTSVTGINGTALFTITLPATASDMYSGTGGLLNGCVWDSYRALPVAGVVVVQIFRPTNASGMTCSL